METDNAGYWTAFDVGEFEAFTKNVICFSSDRLMVYGPEQELTVDPVFPLYIGPFDLDNGFYTDCYYQGRQTTQVGYMYCAGNHVWPCIAERARQHSETPQYTCPGGEVYYHQVSCPYVREGIPAIE